MSNVIDIFRKPNSAITDSGPEEFEAEVKANKRRKKRMTDQRKKANNKVLRSYNIKPKGE